MINLYFPAMQEVADRVARAPHVLLALDYDGTLTPIVDDPGRALLQTPTREVIESMAQQGGVDVAIISGRALKDLQRLVGIPGLLYAGNHGMEIKGPALNFIEPTANVASAAMHELGLELAELLAHIPGVFVEDKGLTLSIHHRRVAPVDAEEVWRTVLGAVERVSDRFHVTPGAKVYEVRPLVRWNKGAAVTWIREQLRIPDTLVIYIGDDFTDEDAFAALSRIAVTVRVGDSATTAAHYLLPSPAEVHAFLSWVHELLQEKANNAAAH
jgi:trehalose-phosphatase